MNAADASAEAGLQQRLHDISAHEHDDASRAALSAKDLGIYAAVTLGITLLGFLVLAL